MSKIFNSRQFRKGVVDVLSPLVGLVVGVAASLAADLDPQVAGMVTAGTASLALVARRWLRDYLAGAPS